MDTNNPRPIPRWRDIEKGQHSSQSLRVTQLPLPHAQRPLLPAWWQPRPKKGERLDIRCWRVVCRWQGGRLLAYGLGKLVRVIYQGLDYLATYAQGLLLARQHQRCSCLWRRAKGQPRRSHRKGVAAWRKWHIVVDTVYKRWRATHTRRQVGRQAATLRT